MKKNDYHKLDGELEHGSMHSLTGLDSPPEDKVFAPSVLHWHHHKTNLLISQTIVHSSLKKPCFLFVNCSFSSFLYLQYFLAWLIFCLLGVGLLFPWNAFLGALDYFADIYPDISGFPFILSLVYNWPSVIALLLTVKFGSKFSFTSRIVIGFSIDVLVQILVPCINLGGVPQYGSLVITLGGVFLTGKTLPGILKGSNSWIDGCADFIISGSPSTPN